MTKTDRQTDKQTDRETETDRDRQRQTERIGMTKERIDRSINRQTC